MPPEHLQYLTTQQTLADLPYFARDFKRDNYPRSDLRPQSTPWIMIGGSYSGSRAAFTRNEYPEIIYAAYASSAPLHAQVNMSVYYDQIYRGMVANGYSNCIRDVQAALEYIDDQLSNNETAAAVKQLFFGLGAETNSNGDFTLALGGIYGFFQGYGTEGPAEGSVHSFCTYLETDPITHNVAGPNGLASVHGNKFTADRFASWAVFTSLVNMNYGTNCKGLNHTLPTSCDLGRPITEPDNIAWAWQYCTEWGFFQIDNAGPRSLLSRYQTLEYNQDACNQAFPKALASGLLPSRPQAEALNRKTGGWTIRPSNVYWTGGQFDPWGPLSILSTEAMAPMIPFSTDIPACGETRDDRIFGYLMENAEHCFDFKANFKPGAISRSHFVRALKRWLPCFKGKRGVGSGAINLIGL